MDELYVIARRVLFGTRGSDGAVMAARATQPLMDEEQIRSSCEFLAGDLLNLLNS